MDVFAQIGGDRPLQLGNRRRHDVEPPEHAGKPLAEMADDDLQLREAVEHAAKDQADDVNRGFDVPAPAGAREHIAHQRRKTAE